MLGSAFDWYSSNTKIDYPFTEIQPDLIHELFVDAYVQHSKLTDKQQQLRIAEFNTNGDLKLHFADATVLADLTALDGFQTHIVGVYTIYSWVRATTLPSGVTDEDLVVKLVVLTAKLADFVLPITPTKGNLLDSLVNPHVKRVRRIGVALPGAACCIGFAEGDVILESGNNVQLTTPSEQPNIGLGIIAEDTVRPGKLVRVAVIPGAGAGRFNNCTAQDNPLKTINNIGPDAQGNFQLSGRDCTWVEQRVETIGGDLYPNTDYRIDQMLKAALQLHQNCKTCCDCGDYATAYDTIRRLFDRAKIAAARLAALTAIYNQIRDLIASQPCLDHSGLQVRLKAVPQPNYQVSIYVLAYNNTMADLGVTQMQIELLPSGWGLVAGSGSLSCDPFFDTRVDPVVSGSVAEVTFPIFKQGTFAKFSFDIRYSGTVPNRQSIVVDMTANVVTSIGTVQAKDKLALQPPLDLT